MGPFDTPTGRHYSRPATPDTDPGQDGGEVDLLVYCTVSVQVTLGEPYTEDELAEIAAHEVGWNATFVSVDRVEQDHAYRAPMPEPDAAGHIRAFMDRLRRV